MPNFFTKFPKIDYKFADGTTKTLVDINIKYALSDLVKSTTDAFYPFAYRDQDRPDILSDKYYDSSDYYWLLLMSNDVFDINHDLPISQNIFNKYIVSKYKADAIATGLTENDNDVISYTFSTVHHYEDRDGYYIDKKSYDTLGNTRLVYIYDYEFQANEDKRNIRLLESSRKTQVKNELEANLRKLRADLNQ